MTAYLILEDGTIYEGESFGSSKTTICELVFTTGMAGYVESISDPSYGAQGVVMTFPEMGNHGVMTADMEAAHPALSALIVHSHHEIPTDDRQELTLEAWLKKEGVAGISGIDTRALTRKLRTEGTMRGMITTTAPKDIAQVLGEIRNWQMPPQVPLVAIQEKQFFPKTGSGIGDQLHIAVIDYGTKQNMIRDLTNLGANITLYPPTAKLEDIQADNCDGILLSNGPGDPKDCPDQIREIRRFIEADIPMMAICLGHQMVALAVGLDTEKMHFGHRGGNHAVRDCKTQKLYTTSQNHGYVVIKADLSKADFAVEIGFEHVTDGSIEGLIFKDKPVRTYQFHPEASPGPEDTFYLFEAFCQRIKSEYN